MPIRPSELVYHLSAPTGPGLHAIATPAESLGGYAARTRLSDTQRGNLFEDITGDENLKGATEYRCLFVRNGNPTITLRRTKLWLVHRGGGSEVSVGADPREASPEDSPAPQAARVEAPSEAPAGVRFDAPGARPEGLVLGDIPPRSVRAFWVRRQALAGPPMSEDGVIFRVEGDTTE